MSLHPVRLGKPQLKFSNLNRIVQTKQIIWNSTAWQKITDRGGVEDTTLEARPRTQKNFEAKDRPSRGQGQGHRRKCSPKKEGFQKNFFKRSQKKVFKNFFQAKKVFKKFFSGNFHLRETKKRSLQIFCEVSGAFQQNFNSSKNSAASSRGQSSFQGLEASRPRTSKSVLEDVLEAMDVLKDSTSDN